jgi:hypothetical protein
LALTHVINLLARNWGNLASVAGLVFSILAFVFSKRASKAAQEARNATLRQSLSEEANGANRMAGEIVTYVRMGQGEMALLRAVDLMNQTSYFVARWDARLLESSKNNLLSALAQLRSIHEVLSKSTIANLNPKAKAQLAQACQRVNTIFSEERGTAVKAAEGEVD